MHTNVFLAAHQARYPFLFFTIFLIPVTLTMLQHPPQPTKAEVASWLQSALANPVEFDLDVVETLECCSCRATTRRRTTRPFEVDPRERWLGISATAFFSDRIDKECGCKIASAFLSRKLIDPPFLLRLRRSSTKRQSMADTAVVLVPELCIPSSKGAVSWQRTLVWVASLTRRCCTSCARLTIEQRRR